MRREGYIIEEIIEPGNMSESFDYVMRGRKRKQSRTGRYIMRHREEVLSDLTRRISDGTFEVSGYKEYTICERGKERVIQSVPLCDRIALNAIARVVERHLHRRFIADSAASIKGRGGHYLIKRMLRDMRRNPEGTRYVLKWDIKKFYQSISQDIMKDVIRKYFKDKRLLSMLDKSISMLPCGISIGKRDSQVLGNLILDRYLDHRIKDGLGIKHYRRYCDDGVVQSSSLKNLTEVKMIVEQGLLNAGLEMKGNVQMWDILCRDIDFLGIRVFGDGHIKIRRHIVRRFARRWKRVYSHKRKVELIGAFYGQAKHTHARHLFKSITGISMKNFSDFGLTYTSSDGKKRFDCTYYPLGELQNRTLVIEDYETGITTPEGSDRYVVKFRSEELGDGKFITNSDELKQMLDKISEVQDGFPFQTTIKRGTFGKGKIKYSFT